MAVLTHNINIRTSVEVKKRLLDEATNIGMNMSEYLLFVLENYWTTKDLNHLKGKTGNLISSETEATITKLLEEKSELLNKLHDQKKSIWDEAIAMTDKLAKSKIEQECRLAVATYKQQQEQMANDSYQIIHSLQLRIAQYETQLLKTVFQELNDKFEDKIQDLPDVVSILVYRYHQQFQQK